MEICQTELPFAPWETVATARLPGIQPAELSDWLRVDEVYGAQAAHRRHLIDTRREEVIAQVDGAEDAIDETYDAILKALPALGYRLGAGVVLCPDGIEIELDRSRPLETLGRILQEDVNIHLQVPDEPEHRLVASVLCFPASWRLAEKIGRPLTEVHEHVDPYDGALARRVQRMFDALQPDRLLWRANALLYGDPELFQPRSAEHRRRPPGENSPVWLRMERQVLRKLPKTAAVVFTLHTYVLPVDTLPAAQRESLRRTDLWHNVLG